MTAAATEAPPAYQRLEALFARLNAVGGAAAVLHWDQAAMMPKGGAAARSEQLAALATVRHAMLAGPECGELLEAAADADLDDWRAANLREMRRARRRATALTEDQVERLSRATSACETAWRAARAADDFAMVLPKLETALALVRETAAAKAEALGLAPYDALLDEYEPDGRADDIDRIFAELEAFLPEFLQQALERQAQRPAIAAPRGPFAVEAQRALAVRLMRMLGFDFEHGRLDVSLHPFCGGTPDDIRITTRYDEGDFAKALMGVLHETGHALYERGLPAAWRGQPVGEARGMALHESQSLLIEMQVCRSRPFVDVLAPLARETFGGSGPAWEADNLYRSYTRVGPGFIRVDADEVTYPAHVILRYRLERAMIAGDLEARDLPAAWSDGMRRLLGLTPPSDALGCLQDIHWYDGAWGYFPTYTLGALAAAQIFEAARAADPAIAPGVAAGDFAPLIAWLGREVHGRASLLSTSELMAAATGRPLSADSFKRHLRKRYLDDGD